MLLGPIDIICIDNGLVQNMRQAVQFADAYIDGLVQNYNISTAIALGILQSCTNPSIYTPPGLNGLMGWR